MSTAYFSKEHVTVCTDVVLQESQRNKVKHRLKHHLMRMGEFADQWRGQIFKSTGKGLVLHFQSATDAVSWALDFQNRVSVGNMALPPLERIQHRIGIFLGSVTDEETASHLQEVADKGGICISQSIYDAVQTRMNLEVISLGSRQFKNIRDAVVLYKISMTVQNADEPEIETAYNAQSKIRLIFLLALVLLDLLLLIFLHQQSAHAAASSATSSAVMRSGRAAFENSD